MLTATVAGVRILLSGDAETEEQRAMLETVPAAAIRADVLKVAHHGSAYQDPEFVAAVRPAVALVWVGVDNDYGHPNPGLLARLTRGGRPGDADRHRRRPGGGPGGRGLAVVARGVDAGAVNGERADTRFGDLVGIAARSTGKCLDLR